MLQLLPVHPRHLVKMLPHHIPATCCIHAIVSAGWELATRALALDCPHPRCHPSLQTTPNKAHTEQACRQWCRLMLSGCSLTTHLIKPVAPSAPPPANFCSVREAASRGRSASSSWERLEQRRSTACTAMTASAAAFSCCTISGGVCNGKGPSVQPANCWDLLGLASPRFNQPHLWRYRMTLSCTQQAEAGARNTLRCSVVRTLQPQFRGCPALGPIQARRQWKRGLTRHASTWQAFIASLPSLRHVRAGRQQQADVSCAVAQLPGCAHFPTHTSSGRPCPPVVRCGRHCGKGSGSNAAASHRQCRQRRQRKSDVARRCPTGRDGGAAAAEGVGSQVAPFLWPTLQQRRNKTTC